MPLGHIGVNVSAFGGAKAYFDELMPMLTFEPFVVTEGQFSYRPGGGKPGTHIFFYSALETGGYSRHKPGLQHLAFIVESRALVHQVHEWARARGDEVIHGPREFPEYHPGYYATFWYGAEGFMLEAVCHRDEK
ncbi:MAG TPA: extradiol dioxygenase [Actinomycetota bacterium]|nr:extradiol dioxygenase [Actinomycetota bacterium]